MHKLRMKAPFLAALGALLLVAVVNKDTSEEWTPPDRASQIHQRKRVAPAKEVKASERSEEFSQSDASGL